MELPESFCWDILDKYFLPHKPNITKPASGSNGIKEV